MSCGHGVCPVDQGTDRPAPVAGCVGGGRAIPLLIVPVDTDPAPSQGIGGFVDDGATETPEE